MNMPRRRGRAVVIVLLVSWLVAAAGPAWSVTDDDVEQARRQREAAAAERAAAMSDLEEAVTAYENINAEFAQVTFRIGQLRSLMDSYSQQSDDLQQQVRDRAVEAYMHGNRNEGGFLFSTTSMEQAVIAQEILAQ
ncbi:MAG: hypothetical protein MUP76_01245, partial [Acidimicrobiia bacterium]|nr:hypothetical protein [Acidimicrobiia bacterium]